MLILAATGLVLAMIFAALAIDIGFLAADKRTDQKFADLAALDASRDLANIQALADASVARNYVRPAGRLPHHRRRAGQQPDGTGNYVADATGKFVRVTVTSPRKPFFPFVSGTTRTVKAVAVAGAQDVAQFSVGLDSRHPRHPEAGILDQFFGAMLGVRGHGERRQLQRPGHRDVSLQRAPDQACWPWATRRNHRQAASTPTSTMARPAHRHRPGPRPPTATLAATEINDIPVGLDPATCDGPLGDLVNLSQPGIGRRHGHADQRLPVRQRAPLRWPTAPAPSRSRRSTAASPTLGHVGASRSTVIEKEPDHVGPTTGAQHDAKTSSAHR